MALASGETDPSSGLSGPWDSWRWLFSTTASGPMDRLTCGANSGSMIMPTLRVTPSSFEYPLANAPRWHPPLLWLPLQRLEVFRLKHVPAGFQEISVTTYESNNLVLECWF